MRETGRLRCWGIYRELAHSPGRETDDAEILKATAQFLQTAGFDTSLKTPEDVLASAEAAPPFLFVMCEQPRILDTLAEWERGGSCVVNGVDGIRNTYRTRTVALFARDRVPFPRSLVLATDRPIPEGGHLGNMASGWVKRADVHATQPGDVVFAPDHDAVNEALEAMARRGIGQAVLQADVQGDLIKFYGVGRKGDEGRWFTWFYHRDQRLSGYRFDEAGLEATVERAAASLGLEVYGGDAIATESGKIVLIDLNAWPSFALYRDAASERIASHLAARFRKEAGVAR